MVSENRIRKTALESKMEYDCTTTGLNCSQACSNCLGQAFFNSKDGQYEELEHVDSDTDDLI